MTDEITIQQYLAREDLALAAWGGKECVRLEIIMDYSQPYTHPDAPDILGIAGTRFSVLSDDFGNGMSLTASKDDTGAIEAILIAFLYAKILTIDLANRGGLFGRIQNAVRACLASDDWSSLTFARWHLDVPGSPRQIVWPWIISSWEEVEARRPGAFVEVGGTTKCMTKTYTATLLTGPIAPFAPQGWGLRFHQSDPELGRVLLPAAALVAITHSMEIMNFMNEAQDEQDDGGSMLSSLLRRINLYYESPERIPFGAEAMAVRAAMQTILHPDRGDIADYRRQDDAMRSQDRRMVEANNRNVQSPGPSDALVSTTATRVVMIFTVAAWVAGLFTGSVEVVVIATLLFIFLLLFFGKITSSGSGSTHVTRRDVEDPPVRGYDFDDDDGDGG